MPEGETFTCIEYDEKLGEDSIEDLNHSFMGINIVKQRPGQVVAYNKHLHVYILAGHFS